MTRSRGFTLIELMIAIAIIAILAAIAIPNYSEYVRRGRVTEAISALSGMRVKMEQYFQDNRELCRCLRDQHGRPAADVGDTSLTPARCSPAPPIRNTRSRRPETPAPAWQGFQYSLTETNARSTIMVAPSNWPSNANCWVLKRDGSC